MEDIVQFCDKIQTNIYRVNLNTRKINPIGLRHNTNHEHFKVIHKLELKTTMLLLKIVTTTGVKKSNTLTQRKMDYKEHVEFVCTLTFQNVRKATPL